jgi:predicted nucleic acid-binding protein
MNGDKLFLDTNIIIYLLNGDKTLSELLHGKTAYVSFITQLELLSYSGITQKESLKIREFLQECVVIDINDSIKEKIVTLRKLYGLKLPDSIIAGIALFHDMPLICRQRFYTN